MKSSIKIAVIALIIIIVAAVGAYAYLNQPPQQNNQTPETTKYTVTIGPSPNGTTVPAAGTHDSTANSSVTFAGVPNSGYKFDYWVIDGAVLTANPTTKTVAANMTVTPYFTLEAQPTPTPTTELVTIQAAQNGTTTPQSGTLAYLNGANVTLTATANSGYKFDHWQIGTATSTENPVTITITTDLTITPVFTFLSTPVTLTISSTTSLYETGVENDAIKPAFQAKYPWITVNFLAQGTGAAIQTAIRGDADMIMVHDPGQENTFLTNGFGVNRKIIGYNFFIIVGPQNDPAGITGLTPLDAMKKIYQLSTTGTPAIWVSRGDGSGTNSKEKNLWAAAGINWTQIRTQTSWYKETGQGMTATLVVANYFLGYTLADTASYLTNTNAKNINMKIVVQAQKDLLNVYSVIADNPLNPNLTSTHFEASMLFIQYMVSEEGQQLLANYGFSTFGQALFSPFVPLASNPASNATLLGWIKNYAYIPANATECPAPYRYNAGTLYSPAYDTLSSITSSTVITATYNVPSGPANEKTMTIQTSFTSYIAGTATESQGSPVGKNRY